ncbi:MAG: TldD/PmbA family protein [Anaerolineae bacterium]|nr:TldD/PmbA family protein [Chloroflexota bacterium]
MTLEPLEWALRANSADYCEIRLETRLTTRIVYHGQRLETVSTVVNEGGIVRALSHQGGWGLSTFNNQQDLANRVEQACHHARLVPRREIALAPHPVVIETLPAARPEASQRVTLEEQHALISRYNTILLGHPQIVDTSAMYIDRFVTVSYANSEGTRIIEERPMTEVMLGATARDGTNVQRSGDGSSSAMGHGALLELDELASSVARRARSLLSAETVVGGVYPVICDPRLAGVFVHEAFGHLSESDFVYTNPQAQEMMSLGRRFGGEQLNIVDDGTLEGERGTHRFDDEGTPTQRTPLVQKGILVGRLHSRETAGALGERATGNARATDFRYPPIVRMTNTFIEPQDRTLEQMLADVDLGVYACQAIGGMTMLENFSFSAGYGYMIRGGQVAELVKDVVLAGNLFSTLANIDAIGNDLTFSRTGNCGKGQGGGLPVGIGAPHIRIQDVAMGGRQA